MSASIPLDCDLIRGSENPSIDADALPGRQEGPSLFGDVFAVLIERASDRVNLLRRFGDVPEHAIKSAD